MIRFTKNKNQLTVKGHAEQSEYGQDIVCASVSTAIIMTVNLIEIFSKLDSVEYELEEGFFKITIINNNDIVNNIINNLEFTLDNLKNQYPKYIK